MNTTNYEPMRGLTWEKVFSLQESIMCKYEPQLREKTFPGGFDINTLEDQELVKKFIGRITEELCEAREALNILVGPHSREFEKQLADHVVEELVDAFNFFIELHILLGAKFEENTFGAGLRKKNPQFFWSEAVYWMGMASNKLKNRGWRDSQYLVDLRPFNICLSEATMIFGELFAFCGITREEAVFEAWSLKYQVNVFRIETKY